MSNAYSTTVKAMADNPELANKVMAAGTPAERAEILKAAGLDKGSSVPNKTNTTSL